MTAPHGSFLAVIVAIVLAAPSLRAQNVGTAVDSTVTQYQILHAEPGERCIVCGASLTRDDIALIVKGRRVPLERTMVNDFMRNRDFYFAKLEPASALFQEDFAAPRGTSQGGVSAGWFLAGLYILVALISGGLSGYAAVTRGLKPVPQFFIGFLFSLPGYLFVLSRSRKTAAGRVPPGLVKVPSTSAPVLCPACGNANHPSAKTCAACNAALTPLVSSEVSRADRPEQS